MKRFIKLAALILGSALVFGFASCDISTGSNEPTLCKVSYETEHGTAPESISVEEGTALTAAQLPSLTADGYTFDGWYDDDTKAEAGYKVTKDVSLTAKWTAVNSENKPETGTDPQTGTVTSYTVTFSTNGGSEVASQTVESGKTATEPAAPTKDGYTFTGWYNGDTAFDFETAITASITLTAKFTAITYKITYAGIDGATNPNTVTTYTIESDDITLADASKTGFTFGGWKNAQGEAVPKIAHGKTGNITLTAIWSPATNTAYKVLHYKQNLDDDGYTLADTDNLTGTTGAQTAAAAKTYEHFTVGTVTQTTIAADGSTEVKIYYTRETVTFTVDLAGGVLGTYTESISLSGKYGKSLAAVLTEMYGQPLTAMPNPTRSGYTFSGWNINGGTIPQTLERSATYTALWTTASGISVTVAPASAIKITQTETESTITLTAEEGFTGYSWRIDGEPAEDAGDDFFTLVSVSDDGRSLTLKKSLYRMFINSSEGLVYKTEDAYLINGEPYQISLSATKNGIPYGSQVSVTQNYIRVSIKETAQKQLNPNPFGQSTTVKKLLLNAEEGFTDYRWSLPVTVDDPSSSDAELVFSDGISLELYESMFAFYEPGSSYQIILTATKDGIQYTTELLLIVRDDDVSSNG